MASVRPVQRAGGIAYQVRWRERTTGVQTSETFDPDKRHEAYMLKRFLDANGNTYSLAAEAYRISHADGPELSDVCERHIDGLGSFVDERTKSDYRRDVRLHILPYIGQIRAAQLTTRHVADWIERLIEDGCAPKSIANYHGLLSAIMTTCVGDKIREDNPCKDVRLPKQRKRARRAGRFLEIEEYELLLSKVPDAAKLHIETLAGTGLRWGEFAALNVSDFHPSRGRHPAYLDVTKAVKRAPGGLYFIGPPKTENSVREVTIDEYLEEGIAALCEGRDGAEPLFTGTRTGGRLDYNSFRRHVWVPAVEAAVRDGLSESVKIHGLRHSHGSWLAEAGVDLPTISERLGHESIQTTVNVYGHISARQNRTAADAMGSLRRR